MEGCFTSGPIFLEVDVDDDCDAEKVVLRCGGITLSSNVLLAEYLRCFGNDDNEVMLDLRMLAMKDTCDSGAAPGHE